VQSIGGTCDQEQTRLRLAEIWYKMGWLPVVNFAGELDTYNSKLQDVGNLFRVCR